MKIDVSEATVVRAIRHHAYAFSVLEWSNSIGRKNPPMLVELQESVRDVTACAAWLAARWSELPATGRPEHTEIPLVAGLFKSFFSVSFKVSIDRGLDGSVLGAKILHTPRSSAKPRGMRGVEIEALQRLAIDAGIRRKPTALRQWRNIVRDADVQLWLYAVELVARSEDRSIGVPAMVLWRRLDPVDRSNLIESVAAARARMLAVIPNAA